MILRKWLTCILLLIIGYVYASNDNNNTIASLIKNRIPESNVRAVCYENTRCDTILVNRFYIQNNFTPIWIINNKPNAMALNLINLLKNSAKEGFHPLTYRLAQITKLINDNQSNSNDLTSLELSLTNAFFMFSSNMAFGKINTTKDYPNWGIKKREFNLIDILNNAVTTQNLLNAMHQLYPTYSGYYKLQDKLNQYQIILADNRGFENIPKGTTLKIKSTGHRVTLLNKRLILTGELNPQKISNINKFSLATKKAVMLYQKNNGLDVTGTVNKFTLQSLNVPLRDKINTMAINMDRMRYLPNDISNESCYIWINIPDFTLKVVTKSGTILSMPIIVGNDKTKSCILNSKISYMEINPYWTVPRSILIKDMLPKLKESGWYLENKGFIIYKNTINESNLVNGNTINWNNVTPNNLNYIFRQLPNKKNALGQIKFIFPNNCGIYLHDTPDKNLFKHTKRDYSHGCIRVGEPTQLALFLLQNNPEYNESSLDSIINAGKRRIVTPNTHEAVHIVYFTAWVDSSGNLQFRPDVYGLDKKDYYVNGHVIP